MPSSESDGQPPPRKRSRASANGEEQSNKKARGRPRVDTQDATAADRRRTQIRLAQRAYRQRKETTIASLKQRNARLQDIIEKMNKGFLGFNELAVKSGLLRSDPRLGQELKSVTEYFVTLARAAESEEEHEDHEGESENGTVPDAVSAFHSAATIARSSNDTGPRSPPKAQHTEVGWGYSASFWDVESNVIELPSQHEEQSLNSGFFPVMNTTSRDPGKQNANTGARAMGDTEIIDQQKTHQVRHLPFGLMEMQGWSRNNNSHHRNTHAFSVNIPTPDISPRISPPNPRLPSPPLIPAVTAASKSLSSKPSKQVWTYSHDETTFARRITRASLEAGFHLLSNAHQRPAALNYVFKLSLPYLDINHLLDRFKTLLSRGTEEDLDSWETPFIHLGGAGLHYPRKDVQGNVIPFPNSWTVKPLGPANSKLVRVESTADPSRSHDLEVDLTGLEGEWFDSHDVQGYLEAEKGCHINPRDSFAEVVVEVDDDDIPSSSHLPALMLSKAANPQLFSSMDRSPSSSLKTPDLSNGSSGTESTKSTPGSTADPNLEAMFAPNETFGLDINGADSTSFGSMNNFRFKYNENDVSAFFDEPLGLDLAPGFMNNNLTGWNADAFADTSTLPIGLDLMGAGVEMPVVRQKSRKTAWVDISKLVDEIIRHGVCLGRAPGFRRKDVDMAFQASLVHSF